MISRDLQAAAREVKFRDPELARRLAAQIARHTAEIGRSPVSVMHVCGSHEQAIAKWGLRANFPKDLNVIMGPGCPVCITDMPEVDEGVALARQGVVIATYGDMVKVPGTVQSLADAQAEGAEVHVVYSAAQAVELARQSSKEVVFFATGFETTAVATAAIVQGPAAPELLRALRPQVHPAGDGDRRRDARDAGRGLPRGRARRRPSPAGGSSRPSSSATGIPVVVAGFEPLDILAGLARLVELVRDRTPRVVNMFPRCVTREGNLRAQEELWSVFRPVGGRWRGIAHVPNGNLRLRDEWAHVDARRRFSIDLTALWDYAPPTLAASCICGDIMSGIASPTDCTLFGRECVPDTPVGACMVSSEGTCKIWHQYGGIPNLGERPVKTATIRSKSGSLSSRGPAAARCAP